MSKESNSTANEGKRQFNRSIIYNLDSIVRVNNKKGKSILLKVNNNQLVFPFDFNRTFKVYKFYYTLCV